MAKLTRQIFVGGVPVGGGAPVTVQSMTNTDTANAEATAAQINALSAAGCEIVRSSVYNMACAKALRDIKSKISIPLVADIHFDYRLAIAAIENGADKLRFNPGNIGGEDRVRSLVACAKEHRVPIRIGVNAGSLEAELKQKHAGNTVAAMVESALRHVKILEREGFEEIVLSLKASDVRTTVEAYREISRIVDYPLHVGVTETGDVQSGIIKSAAGIGALLLEGIGDTIRVSLTDDPVREVEAGLKILRAVGLRKDDIELVSCPTCGRTRVDVMKMVEIVNSRLPHHQGYLKVAVMGCAVNGPGEASDADIGVAFGNGNGILFVRDEQVYHGSAEQVVEALIERATTMLEEQKKA
ncbi:4-hydroxy-3-methylbut-2-en-1-yl diphosphate synthase (flavodoxin) [bioreactor metagenome]|uniref:4-hydroxy-3-methylbut-2-en-1-yl diphosphate synthase (Flavodoxin) n=1 Tax=bioreactor metagenome TaxID=1076179 RepID=A0A644YIV7_9ZZZZ